MSKPKRCCYNCEYAMEGCGKGSAEFNKTRRFCGVNNRMPSYKMDEKRSCKNFELSKTLPIRKIEYLMES